MGSVVSRTQDQRRNLIHWMKGLLMDSLTVNENDFNQMLATTTTPCANKFHYATSFHSRFVFLLQSPIIGLDYTFPWCKYPPLPSIAILSKFKAVNIWHRYLAFSDKRATCFESLNPNFFIFFHAK